MANSIYPQLKPTHDELKKLKYLKSIRENWLKLNRIFNPSVPTILPPPTNPELNYPQPASAPTSAYSESYSYQTPNSQPPITIINNSPPPVTIINNPVPVMPTYTPSVIMPILVNESTKSRKKATKKEEKKEEKTDENISRIVLGIIGFVGVPITVYLLGSNYSRWKIAKELNKDCHLVKRYRLTDSEYDLVHMNSKNRKSIQSNQAIMLASKSLMCISLATMFLGSYLKHSNLRTWSAFSAFGTVCVQLFEYTRYKVMSEKEDADAINYMSTKAQ